MYPRLYQKWFQLNLNPTELILIEILMKVIALLSKATLGNIANNLPLPILADSRIKTMQRFLDSRNFCKEKIWWGIWMELMTGYWLLEIGWGYCLRIEKSTYVHLDKQESVTLNQLASHPGISIFLRGVDITKTSHKFPFNVVAHYPSVAGHPPSKEHHGLPITEGWFLLTTLPDINSAVTAYATRFQIEEMFRDYKSYGFNLELIQLTGSRFDAWFLLLTLVYSTVIFTSICTSQSHQKYVARTSEPQRQYPRTSMFTIGKIVLFSHFDWNFISSLISRYIRLNRHKIDFYLRNLNIYNPYHLRV